MSTTSFGANTSSTAYTDKWVHTTGVSYPSGRNTMFNGTTQCLVLSMGAYVAGNGATRTVSLGFEGGASTANFSVGSGGSAVDTGAQAIVFVSNGGTGTFRITSNGSFHFGRSSSGTSTDNNGTSYTGTLGGYMNYVSGPTAPTSPTVVASGTTGALVSWAVPSDNGDAPITGYRVDYSTSATFASAVTSIEVGNVLSYTVTGLASSTAYYFRVFAENSATQSVGSWSQPTSTVSLTSGTGTGVGTQVAALTANVATTTTYPTASCGVWSMWYSASATSWYVQVAIAGSFGGQLLRFGVDPTVGFWASTTSNANPMSDGPTYRPAGGFTGEHRFSVAVGALFGGSTWTFPLSLYVDGVLTASGSSTGLTAPATFTNTNRQPTNVQVGTYGTTGTVVMSRLSHTLTLAHEEYATRATEAGYLSAAAAATPQVTLGTLPTNLATAPVGYLVSTGQSTLDALNLIMRTEQGYIDTVTTGSVTNPVQSIRVRGRDRPATVSYAFDAQQELAEMPTFVRDSTNLIWSDQVTGANSSSRTVSQVALQARAGSNNASDTVATYVGSDLYEYGTDRLWRGQNVSLRPVSVKIDNLQLAADRSADLLAMVPGDRIQITNILSTVLGFSTWDGWLLDKEQLHTSGPSATDTFILYLQPCQPGTAVYDTDLYVNGGSVTLTTALTVGATSAVFGSADSFTWLSTTTPYTLLIDSEQVTVTAAAAPSGGSQTLTITRGVNGTTAATHAIGAAPEVTTNLYFAY